MEGSVEGFFGGTQPLLALVERIYAGVGDPTLWEGTLRQIGSVLGGESIALFAGSPNVKTPHLLSVSEMDPAAWEQYVAYFAAINPVMVRCEELLDPAETWFSHAVLADSELEKTEFYTDFLRRNSMHYSVGMRLQSAGLPAANLSCQRPKAGGAFTHAADVVLQTLRPHLVRALCLRMHLGAMEAQRLGMESALDAYEHAVLGVDSYGFVALCNRHAQALLGAEFGISIQRGRLQCSSPAAQGLLQQLLGRAVSVGSSPGAGNALLLRGNAERTLRVTALPHRCALPGQSAPLSALVFLSCSGQQAGPRAATLRALFGLTPAEARIADLFACGYDTAEIAARLRLTTETARFYTKQILAKTGARRQAELVRLVLSLPAS